MYITIAQNFEMKRTQGVNVSYGVGQAEPGHKSDVELANVAASHRAWFRKLVNANSPVEEVPAELHIA